MYPPESNALLFRTIIKVEAIGRIGAVQFKGQRDILGRSTKQRICRLRIGLASSLLRVCRFLLRVRSSGISLADYPPRRYRSFNDFFTRTILPEKRPVDPRPEILVAPCDGRLTVYPVKEDSRFTVKGVPYTLPQLLRDPALAGSGGTLLLFRLSVSDYHRYIWSLDGIPEAYTRIPGVYHTVHPTAAAARAIYRENTREYSLQHTDRFGDVAVMEVGALLVGRIENHPLSGRVARGQEKGFFAYGGSTILMLLEPGRVKVDQDLLDRSRRDQETPVRLGQAIGRARD